MAFLEMLQPGGPWNLTAIVPDGPVTSATFTDPVEARAWIEKHASRANIHYVANLTPSPGGKGGRARKQDVETIAFLHGDYDVDKLPEDHPLADLPLAERKEAVVRDMCWLESPTLVVDSGGGLQALWRLKEPLPATPENIEWAEGANRWLARQYPGGEPQCADIAHLLRLPGTINHPDRRKRERGRVPVPARLVEHNDEHHKRSGFGSEPAPAKASVENTIGPAEEVTDLQALADAFGLPPRLLAIIEHGHDPEDPDRHPSRSEWVFGAACQLARHGVPGEQIAGVLLNTEWDISASVYDQTGRTPEEYAARQVRNALAVIAGEREAAQRDFDEVPLDPEHLPGDGPARDDPARPHRFKRWSIEELIELPPPAWTVEGIVLERSLGMLYGEPKSFKTFIALDLALCVATGRPFHGVDVVQGRVCYVAAEGHPAETRDRILAWCRENGVEASELRGRFALVISGVQLDKPDSVKEFIRLDPAPCDLMFFDTLNRNMEGHENDTQDMTRVVAGCDLVRRTLNTAVIVVHHTGVNQARERGSTVMRGAVDARLRVSFNKQANVATLLVEDVRAGPAGKQIHLSPATIILDSETLGGSVVMRQVDSPVGKRGYQDQTRPASSRDRLLIEICEREPKVQADLVDRNAEGRSQSRVSAHVRSLVEDGLLEKGSLTMTEAGRKRVEELRET